MNMISKVIHPSLGAWRAVRVETAIKMARSASEPLFGSLDCSHAQVCPQNPGKLTPETAAQLREQNPDVQFRLHANAQAIGWSSLADASTLPQFRDYFDGLQRISEAFGASGYTWHSGERRNATLDEVLDRTRALQDEWGIEVGIEGMYPTGNDRYILSTWGEYRTLLESGVSYALDLSHLNILAHRSGVRMAWSQTYSQALRAWKSTSPATAVTRTPTGSSPPNPGGGGCSRVPTTGR